MAKLYFYYSTMNAGKSTTLLQSSYNYRERNMNTIVYTAAIDDRFAEVSQRLQQEKIHCVLVDEAQFLTKQQVYQLSDVVDKLKIPVLCYGLRTDFQAELFEGSKYLLAWADQLEELKTICYCGRKANFVLRLNEQGEVIKEGEQIQIGGNDSYLSVCRYHYKEKCGQL